MGSNDMSEIDPKGLEAAIAAYRDNGIGRPCIMGVAAAIRAYDAHKASAVSDEVAEMVRWIRSTLDWSPQAQRAADLLEHYAVISTTTTPTPPPD